MYQPENSNPVVAIIPVAIAGHPAAICVMRDTYSCASYQSNEGLEAEQIAPALWADFRAAAREERIYGATLIDADGEQIDDLWAICAEDPRDAARVLAYDHMSREEAEALVA